MRDSLLKDDWVFKDNLSKLVTDLVNSSAKMVGHNLEVTELPAAFPLDTKTGKNLITRSLSRGVVADCFEHSEPGSTYAGFKQKPRNTPNGSSNGHLYIFLTFCIYIFY